MDNKEAPRIDLYYISAREIFCEGFIKAGIITDGPKLPMHWRDALESKIAADGKRIDPQIKSIKRQADYLHEKQFEVWQAIKNRHLLKLFRPAKFDFMPLIECAGFEDDYDLLNAKFEADPPTPEIIEQLRGFKPVRLLREIRTDDRINDYQQVFNILYTAKPLGVFSFPSKAKLIFSKDGKIEFTDGLNIIIKPEKPPHAEEHNMKGNEIKHWVKLDYDFNGSAQTVYLTEIAEEGEFDEFYKPHTPERLYSLFKKMQERTTPVSST